MRLQAHRLFPLLALIVAAAWAWAWAWVRCGPPPVRAGHDPFAPTSVRWRSGGQPPPTPQLENAS